MKLIEAARSIPTDQAPNPLDDWRDLAQFANDLIRSSILREESLLWGGSGKATEKEAVQ